ncbi:hypothetical protein ACFL1A_02260 [Patescibacteria group bacterium]
MSKNKIVLSSLAMDLKRVALAYHRGSDKVAERFMVETKRWIKELDYATVPKYIDRIIYNINNLTTEDKAKVAEDSLMYSTLIQNYITV